MKKYVQIIFLSFALIQFIPSAVAQLIEDNFEAYSLGPVAPQSPHWSIWPAGTSSLVSTEQAFSGTQSLKVSDVNTENNLLLLGNQNSGVWVISWHMYIPENATGYYNIQEDEAAGMGWNMNVYFNQGGVNPGSGLVLENSEGFEYPEDTWFTVSHTIDLDNDLLTLRVNNVEVFNNYTFTGNLGAIDFYSLDELNTYFIDDAVYEVEVIPCVAPTAQICDNFDFYTLGPIDVQSDNWEPWTIGGPVSNVSIEQAFSNTQSLKVGPGGLEDNLLLLNNESAGIWRISWQMYIPAGATGYYNIQEDEIPAIAWNMEVYFNQGAFNPGNGNVVENLATFTYPEDVWFEVSQTIDLDNDFLALTIDGVEIFNDYAYFGNIGSIDFFSVDGFNTYYIDDVIYEDITSVNISEVEINEDFILFPNPSEGLINISSPLRNLTDARIRVFDFSGKMVTQLSSLNSENIIIDLSDFQPGLYLIEIKNKDSISLKKIILR